MTDNEARLLNYCMGCGATKEAGEGRQIVCWGCWRREDLPYKYWSDGLQAWVDKLAEIKTEKSIEEKYNMLLDGVVVFTGTANECFEWVHKNTPYSFDLAIKQGGYTMNKK